MHCKVQLGTDTVPQGPFMAGTQCMICAGFQRGCIPQQRCRAGGFCLAEGGSAADAMALAAARAFIGGGEQAEQFAQTIQRAIQLFNCSDGLQATLAGKPFTCSVS